MGYNVLHRLAIICLTMGVIVALALFAKTRVSRLESGPIDIAAVFPKRFQLDRLNNEFIDLKKVKTKAKRGGIVVHFWGTWCAPCEKELPDLLALAAKFEAKNLPFLLIAGNDTKKKVSKFLQKRNIKLPNNVIVGIDQTGVWMKTFGSFKVPETFYYDSKLVLKRKFVGPQSWDQSFVDILKGLMK